MEDDCVKETEYNNINIDKSYKMEGMTGFNKQNSASTVNEIAETEAIVKEVQESGIKQLKLFMLKNEMSIKPHIKTRGRPKNTGVIWPSKSRVTGKRKKVQIKENISATKKVQLENKEHINKRKLAEMGNSAYLAKRRRESSILKSTTNDNVSLLNIDEQQSVSTSPMFEVYGHKILKADIEILELQSGWLNDSLINAGLNMLRSQFPGSSGLYDVSLANTLFYPDETHKDFIQILKVRHSHWVCVSNKSCNAGTVKIYDSLRTGDLPLSAKEFIFALLRYQKKKVTLHLSRCSTTVRWISLWCFHLSLCLHTMSRRRPS